VEDMPDGHPDRPAVERVGAGGVQEDAPQPEGGGFAEPGPDFLGVVEALEDGYEGRSSVWGACPDGVDE